MILYYTGTGNSRYAAELLGQRLDDTVRDCNPFIKNGTTPRFHSETPWVFVCPTYAWQIPHIFAEFLTRCRFSGSKQAYFVMTCGGEVHSATETNRKLCARLGLEDLGTAEIVMPENYIALFPTPNSAEEVHRILAAAVPVLEQTAAAIAQNKPITEPKPTAFGKFMTYIVNPIFYTSCVRDRAFTVDSSCIGCGKCAALCPMNNIELHDGKPRWNGRCTHCMACISYCPKAAIAYGKKSRTRRIYTCPPYRPADR